MPSDGEYGRITNGMSRWLRFLIAIACGAALGLFYGWVVNPVKYVDTTPDTLRVDYRSDYVLMVAEAYSAEGDLAIAVQRLAFLGSRPPVEIVREALLFAESQGYADEDVRRIQALETALENWTPGAGTITP